MLVWVERRTLNVEHRMLVRLLAGAALFGGGDAGYENPDELVGFVENGYERLGFRDELCALDELNPALGFAKFLERDTELVDEVRRGFRRLGFAVVGERGGAGAEHLARDVALGIILGKRLRKRDDARTEIQQPLL